MPKPQFSVAALLALVTFVAVACAALVKPSPLWASLLLTASVSTVVVTGLSAWFRRGRRKGFSAGFASVGAAYLVLVFGPGFSATIGPRLLTTHALTHAERRWHDGRGVSFVTY